MRTHSHTLNNFDTIVYKYFILNVGIIKKPNVEVLGLQNQSTLPDNKLHFLSWFLFIDQLNLKKKKCYMYLYSANNSIVSSSFLHLQTETFGFPSFAVFWSTNKTPKILNPVLVDK